MDESIIRSMAAVLAKSQINFKNWEYFNTFTKFKTHITLILKFSSIHALYDVGSMIF